MICRRVQADTAGYDRSWQTRAGPCRYWQILAVIGRTGQVRTDSGSPRQVQTGTGRFRRIRADAGRCWPGSAGFCSGSAGFCRILFGFGQAGLKEEQGRQKGNRTSRIQPARQPERQGQKVNSYAFRHREQTAVMHGGCPFRTLTRRAPHVGTCSPLRNTALSRCTIAPRYGTKTVTLTGHPVPPSRRSPPITAVAPVAGSVFSRARHSSTNPPAASTVRFTA